MNSYSINSNDFPSDEIYQELQRICSMTVEKISSISPSDNDVVMDLLRDGDKFLATIKVSSREIKLFTENIAISPFMAIAESARVIMDKVQKWSVSRKEINE